MSRRHSFPPTANPVRDQGFLLKRPSPPLPDLRRPPRYGVYLWWPEEGFDWVHPDDVELAFALIPSKRVFCRQDDEAPYSLLRYGKQSIRVKPTMWYEVESEGYELDDLVEVKSKMGKLKPMVATIADIFWNRHDRKIDYFLHSAGRRLERAYRGDDLQMVPVLNQPIPVRKMEMFARSRIG
ncbi:MAG: hypothetical protein MK108_06475 [Mariniblastus sp.]|nr:hypothetical protein [Mariniblastus sp.]